MEKKSNKMIIKSYKKVFNSNVRAGDVHFNHTSALRLGIVLKVNKFNSTPTVSILSIYEGGEMKVHKTLINLYGDNFWRKQ